MAGFQTSTNEHLIRSNLWSNQLKKVLEDELMGTRYVKMITDFPDGDTLNIPSIGAAEVNDYVEGNAVQYTSMDTGNFTFTINKYKSSATWITDKMKQDSFYMNELVASFLPSQARALAEAMESDILTTIPDGQTSANANAINGQNHRWIGSGTNETIDVTDFAKARYSLQMANVPLVNLVAIVDPSVEFKLSTQANIVNLMTPQPQWGRIVNEGGLTGMAFKYNIYGFDVYVSQHLKTSVNETIGGKTSAAGVANLFFSAAPDLLPVVGLIRQPPKVDSEYNKDFQREEYVTTCRYGFKTYRPENAVVVITDTDQISF
jgi:hypothetical protein